ncbi:MAG TPA: hypothetical protein VKA70_12370 [Blastocatellia bacterium]|nr:hypothetical protein [Blastocatellia bacterium]
MTVKYSDGRPDEVRRLSVSDTAEVTIQIEERDGQQFIVIREQPASDAAASQTATSQHSVEIPAALLPELKRAVTALEQNIAEDPAQPETTDRRFAHASEEEFARILDFYHIAWQYEPRAFAIEWDADGNVTKSFTPDFYLPEHDLYIELTTLKQALVTKKNRKVRLLRELYPDVNIKVLYAADYRKLVEKFAASGTWQEGQP